MKLSKFSRSAEPHGGGSEKLNWLRAAVLGANDGIVSTASLVVGVAGATSSAKFILTAGIAGLVAGALSMGVGEFISVSTQRDTENAWLAKEKEEVETEPVEELAELERIYRGKGLSEATAKQVALELTRHDVLEAHVSAELGIDTKNLTNPWHAAFASTASFVCGSIIPIVIIILAAESFRVIATFIGVVAALFVTGALSAKAGGASKRRAVVRVVTGGLLAMLVTYGIGKIFGISGI